MPLYSIDEAIAALNKGRMIILLDDPKWENEGSLLMAAEKVTPMPSTRIIKSTVSLCYTMFLIAGYDGR